MAAILLVAHAPLATSLLAVARHVYPEFTSGLAAVDIGPTATPEQAERQIRGALDALESPEVLLLVDVYGASPCKSAMAVASAVRARVVAGVNVNMLWRALCYAKEPLDVLVARAVDGGLQGVMQVGGSRPQNQGTPPGSDDQGPHHNQ